VEDDALTSQAIAAMLTQQNYAVEIAGDAETGWQLTESFPFDLVLLDVVLPQANGLELCRRLRSQGYQMPILLLTGRDSSHDKAIGLDAGADDYLVKPFDPEELVARIRALLRRGGITAQPVLKWGLLRLDPSNCQVAYNGVSPALTPKEYALLELFLRNSRRVFSCGAILEHVWAFEEMPGEDAVRTHIKGLRQKLKAVGAADLIETVYGIGYRLKPLEDREKAAPPLRKSPPVSTVSSPVAPHEPGTLAQQHTLAAISRVWEKFTPRIRGQVALLHQAIAALTAHRISDDLHQQAIRDAHSLAGSLGTFGLAAGSKLAREIEQLLQPLPIQPTDLTRLEFLVTALQQQVDAPRSTPILPTPTSNPNRHPAQPASQPSSPLTARLLVLDDDPSILELLHRLLEPWGLQVTTLADPQQFWQVLEQTMPDLLILDLHMPPPDGLELCQALRQSDRWDSLPIMVLTADADPATVNQVFSAGADDFVSKPFVGPELVTRIVNRLERVRMLQRLSQRQEPGTASLPEAQLFDRAADLLCIVGFDGTFQQVNPAFEHLLGYPPGERVPRSLLEWVHPGDREETLSELEQLQQGKLTLDFEHRYRCQDGSYRWLEWRAVPVVADQRIYAIARDITARKQQEQAWRKSRDEFELRVAERTAELVSVNQQLQRELDLATRLEAERDRVEAALRFSQARFAGILEIADDAIIAIDAQQTITLFNQGAEKIFGYTAQEVLGQSLDILLPMDVVHTHRQPVFTFAHAAGEARRMGERHPILGRRRDGSQFPAEASISHLDLGNERVFTVILRDISAQQEAQEALQQSEERLRLLLDGVEDYAIFMLDPGGMVEGWNPGAEKIHGYRAAEIIGQSCARFYPEADQQRGKPAAMLQEAAALGRLAVAGWRIRADGSRFYADTVITALRSGSGNLRGFTEITRDITEVNRREAERKAVERMKDEFVSVVSHELRTPLTSIHGSLQLLTSGLLNAESPRGKRLIQIAADSTDRLVRLINDILDLERIESGKVSMLKAPCRVANLVTAAVEGVQAIADQARILISTTTIEAAIAADRDRIIQTLTNILSNAIKFSPQGSTIWVNISQPLNPENNHPSDNRSAPSPHPGQLLFSIRDEGRGIPPDKLEAIFERFQQVDASDSRHQDGTGLGLTICRSIVQQHGGSIWVESEVGKGSTFYFTLPGASED